MGRRTANNSAESTQAAPRDGRLSAGFQEWTANDRCQSSRCGGATDPDQEDQVRQL